MLDYPARNTSSGPTLHISLNNNREKNREIYCMHLAENLVLDGVKIDFQDFEKVTYESTSEVDKPTFPVILPILMTIMIFNLISFPKLFFCKSSREGKIIIFTALPLPFSIPFFHI